MKQGIILLSFLFASIVPTAITNNDIVYVLVKLFSKFFPQ